MKRTNYICILLGMLSSASLLAQLPNPGFEKWDSLTEVNSIRIYNPVDWISSNINLVNFGSPQTIEITTDANSGDYAVKLTSAVDDNQEQATYLSSGNSLGSTANDPATEKFPLPDRINGFEGYYKYIPNGNDQFRVFLALYRNGTYLGQSYMELGTSTDTYTKFWWPVNFPATMDRPDSAKFIIEPSIYNGSVGSVLFIDDLSITYGFATALHEVQQTPAITIYPNPAKDEITVFGYDPRHHYVYSLSALDGKQIRTDNLVNGMLQTDFLETGLYILTLTDENGQTTNLKFAKVQ